MLYDRFANSPETRAQHRRRLQEKFLPDLEAEMEATRFTRQEFLAYAERHHLILSDNMLKRYVSLNLLPRPMLRRYFSNQHIALFNILDRLRDMLEVWEIRQLLLPLHEPTSLTMDGLTAVEWLYPHLQRSTSSSRVQRLRPLLEEMIRSAEGLRSTQQLHLLDSLADLKDLCDALELSRQQFALRRNMERRWRDRHGVQLAGFTAENEAVPQAAEPGDDEAIARAAVRLKRLRTTR